MGERIGYPGVGSALSCGRRIKFQLWHACLALQFLVVIVISIQHAFRPYGGHWAIFTTGGRYLLEGKNPYGVEWGFGGLWFYSPVCGWFFGVLSFLPHWIGIILFNLGSHLVLLEGIRRYVEWIPKLRNFNVFASLFLILSTGELIGAYQSIKIEMLMIGILLIATSWITTRPFLAAFLCALIINFKWFPLAPVGLLCLSEIRERNFRFIVSIPLFSILLFLVPFVPYGWDFTKELYQTQNDTLSRFVSEVWVFFPSIFGMMAKTFGITPSAPSIRFTMIVTGLFLAALVSFSSAERKQRYGLALALGTLYIVNFNLLSQFNAYSIATPALAYALSLTFSDGLAKQASSILGVTCYWVIVSMLYSDLVPHSLRDHCRDILLKPMGSLILLVILCATSIWDQLRTFPSVVRVFDSAEESPK